MAKPKVTRTYGPIHFEDLDPHRFEDLIRELIYDYKEWQSIEATGRNGNDGGLDIRAFEKVRSDSSSDEQDDDEEKTPSSHPMDGNQWVVQCKREKEIGPKKLKEIIDEIDSKNPPYGYILAAAANFSRDSYDLFREELKEWIRSKIHLLRMHEIQEHKLQGRIYRGTCAYSPVARDNRCS